MSGYREEDFLQLSGLQHFAFCRRQWALIHIEQQWQENLRTVEGTSSTAGPTTSRPGSAGGCPDPPWTFCVLPHSGDLRAMRCGGVPCRSRWGFPPGEEGLWFPFPIEYKRAHPSPTGPMSYSCVPRPCA